MLGEEFTTIDKEIIDGVSELTNMIYGQAKVMLNTNGYHLTTALPLVIFGQENSLSSFFDNPVVVVPFETEFGTFFVELSQPN
jgi:chemotaxis protein CheX